MVVYYLRSTANPVFEFSMSPLRIDDDSTAADVADAVAVAVVVAVAVAVAVAVSYLSSFCSPFVGEYCTVAS